MAETLVHNPFTGLRPADCVILFHIVILQGSDVMVAVVFAFVGEDAEYFTGCIQRGQAGNGEFYGHTAEVETVAFRVLAIGQGIEDQVDFAVADQSGDILAAFMDLADDVDRHTVVVEVFARPFRSDDVIA